MLLVIGCTVMVRSFVRLQRVELGFKPDHVLTFGINLPLQDVRAAAGRDQFWDRLEQRLQALPGVEGAALVDGIRRRSRAQLRVAFSFPGKRRAGLPDRARPGPSTTEHASALRADDDRRAVRARPRPHRQRYRHVAARRDRQRSVREEVLPQRGSDRSRGRRCSRRRDHKKDKPARIVGVVADMKNAGLDKPAGTELFMPRAQFATAFDPHVCSSLVQYARRFARTTTRRSSSPARARASSPTSIRRSRCTKSATMNDVMWEAVARPRFLTFLLTAFAVVALAARRRRHLRRDGAHRRAAHARDRPARRARCAAARRSARWCCAKRRRSSPPAS